MTTLWNDFRCITKFQKIDTTRSHGLEIKNSFILLGELRLLDEWRLGELLKQMDLKVRARDEKGVIQGNPEVTLDKLGLTKNESFRFYSVN